MEQSSTWIRIKGKTSHADIIVGVYCRPSIQDDDVDELFFEELKDTSESTAIDLMGSFSLPEIN